jgi:hypothetical protein
MVGLLFPALSSEAEKRENNLGDGLPRAAACGLALGYFLSSLRDFCARLAALAVGWLKLVFAARCR